MADKSGEHVHWHDDRRGNRTVIIDGVEHRRVIYTDTKSGVAVVLDEPIRSTDGVNADLHPVWGEVRVFYSGGYFQGEKSFRFGEGPIA